MLHALRRPVHLPARLSLQLQGVLLVIYTLAFAVAPFAAALLVLPFCRRT